MATKVFLTGASGYVGGEALYRIATSSVKHQLRCLVRDSEKSKLISSAFPNVQTVKGDLDDNELIEREARDADVVFHLASTRHEASSRAIAAGLSNSSRNAPAYWIQISGASMFSGPEIKANSYGEVGSKVFDDDENLTEIRSIIESSPARVVDNLVLAQDSSRVKTALIPGPLIYGAGNGPANTRSIQGPELARFTLQNGYSFMVGRGSSSWSNVHITDLGQLFVLLLKAAVEGRDGVWNKDGIFLPENGSMKFGEMAKSISTAARGQSLIESEEVRSLTAEEVNKIMPHGAVLLGTNALLKATKARRDLGWTPSAPSLAEEIPGMVKIEAQRLNT